MDCKQQKVIGGKMKSLLTKTSEELKPKKKLLKPQVERQRRERINRSLDRLRSLLLQEPQQQDQVCRRMEKAEILERTVFFLKKSRNSAQNESAEKQPCREGFSACLRRAALFLRNDAEGRRVERAVATTFSQCLVQPINQDSTTLLAPRLPQITPMVPSVQLWQRNWGSSEQVSNTRINHRSPLAHGDFNIPQGTDRDIHVSAPSCVPTHGTAVWRPWP